MTRGRILTLVIFVAITAAGLTALMAAKDPTDKPDGSAKTAVSGKKLVCLGTVDTEAPVVRILPDNYPMPSKVTKVLAKVGDEVKAGQPLLELDTEMLKLNVKVAEKAVGKAEAAKVQALAMVRGYQPQVDAAEKKLQAKREGLAGAKFGLDELEHAFKYKTATQAQLDEGRAKVKEAQFNLEAAEEDLNGLKKVGSPDYLVAQADKEIERLKVNQQQAQLVLDQFTCKAPADGLILRSWASEGLMFGQGISQNPAFWFLKTGPLIIRAEVSQEFAKRVTTGGAAKIEDEADASQTWRGKVFKVGDQFLPKQNTGGTVDLLTVSDERVLECLISIDVAAGGMPRYGQKVRVTLGE